MKTISLSRKRIENDKRRLWNTNTPLAPPSCSWVIRPEGGLFQPGFCAPAAGADGSLRGQTDIEKGAALSLPLLLPLPRPPVGSLSSPLIKESGESRLKVKLEWEGSGRKMNEGKNKELLTERRWWISELFLEQMLWYKIKQINRCTHTQMGSFVHSKLLQSNMLCAWTRTPISSGPPLAGWAALSNSTEEEYHSHWWATQSERWPWWYKCSSALQSRV